MECACARAYAYQKPASRRISPPCVCPWCSSHELESRAAPRRPVVQDTEVTRLWWITESRQTRGSRRPDAENHTSSFSSSALLITSVTEGVSPSRVHGQVGFYCRPVHMHVKKQVRVRLRKVHDVFKKTNQYDGKIKSAVKPSFCYDWEIAEGGV